jgi:hypothetical protein
VFAALAVPNFRPYFAGQAVSLVGTWMQVVAQSWLVLQLTGSGTLLGPYGGLVADRMDKRRMLLGTQSALGLLADRPGAGPPVQQVRQLRNVPWPWSGRHIRHATPRPCPAAGTRSLAS